MPVLKKDLDGQEFAGKELNVEEEFSGWKLNVVQSSASQQIESGDSSEVTMASESVKLEKKQRNYDKMFEILARELGHLECKRDIGLAITYVIVDESDELARYTFDYMDDFLECYKGDVFGGRKANCVVTLHADLFDQLTQGQRVTEEALASGKLKIEGTLENKRIFENLDSFAATFRSKL
ncbi:unnamed protein product [Gongylonema pulchrum]|uniref:SCP2 domain-containing protein n=1 Tax=Gongylonema pulchrum TaxID=637853 RepID=A0A183D2M5_9BILA|nr:unnamed protein product [Gongylonema pulchrum]